MAAGANPVFRHYIATTPTTGSGTVMATPGNNRVLIIGKITVYAVGAVTATLYIGGAIIFNVTLATGESYTETGLIALSGEAVTAVVTAANQAHFNVFGEEVDAS